MFERACGNASLLLEAGQRSIGIGKWQECPLPYGAQPWLVLYHLCSEAVRTQSQRQDYRCAAARNRIAIAVYASKCAISSMGCLAHRLIGAIDATRAAAAAQPRAHFPSAGGCVDR